MALVTGVAVPRRPERLLVRAKAYQSVPEPVVLGPHTDSDRCGLIIFLSSQECVPRGSASRRRLYDRLRVVARDSLGNRPKATGSFGGCTRRRDRQCSLGLGGFSRSTKTPDKLTLCESPFLCERNYGSGQNDPEDDQ